MVGKAELMYRFQPQLLISQSGSETGVWPSESVASVWVVGPNYGEKSARIWSDVMQI
jgi:hypothetical protein